MALHHSIDHNEGHITINERSSQPQRRPAVKFPEKLMNALDSGKYFDCIRWTADGLAFEIVDPVGVEKKLLKEVFNGTKVQSFIRKIYKWGFVTRTTFKCGAWKIFSHVAFQRGRCQLCRQMKRDMKIGEYSQQLQTSSQSPLATQSVSIYNQLKNPTTSASCATTQRTTTNMMMMGYSSSSGPSSLRFIEVYGGAVSSPYPLCTTKRQPVDFNARDARELLRALQDFE